jgi:PAS domain S-box-containing protein
MHVHVDMRQTAGNYPPIKPVFEADLGLATLLQLPVPVLVLNSERFTVLANKAAKRVLRSPQNASRRCGQDPVPTTIIGTHAAHLGLFQDDGLQTSKLNWDIILGTKVEGSSPKAHEIFVDLGHNGFVQKFSITASPIILDGEIYFSIYFSPSYVPVITDQATETKSSIPTDRQPICGHESIVPAPVVASLTCLSKLAQVEQLRAAVFDSVETVAFLFSADEKTVVMNEAAKKFIGPAAVAAIGYDGAMFIPYFPVYDPEFSEALDIDSFPALHIVRRRENLPARRLGFVHKGTGTKMVMHISGECLYDPATGEFVGALLRLRELQNVSQYLAQRRGDLIKSHETICNVMPHLVWATAPDGKCDYFSDRWYEFTGMSIEESLGYGYHAAVHPEDLPNLLEKWEIGLKTAEDYEIEARYRRHDGVYKWALVRAVPLKDDTGNVMAWYGTNTGKLSS